MRTKTGRSGSPAVSCSIQPPTSSLLAKTHAFIELLVRQKTSEFRGQIDNRSDLSSPRKTTQAEHEMRFVAYRKRRCKRPEFDLLRFPCCTKNGFCPRSCSFIWCFLSCGYQRGEP